MNFDSFCFLHDKLKERIESSRQMSRGYEKKGGWVGRNYSLPPVRNGPI
jgi:hypothetical protein